MNTAHATPTELDALNNACRTDSASLDTSRTQLAQLDPSRFSVTLDVHGSGLARAINSELFSKDDKTSEVEYTLQNLSVYGVFPPLCNDFQYNFLSDQTTISPPQVCRDDAWSADRLGTVLILLPTVHIGGTISLHCGAQRWSHYSDCNFVANYYCSAIGYIAFRQSVRYEISPILSGHLVILTYHLRAAPTERRIPKSLSVINSRASSIRVALQGLLKNSSFLPSGGMIAFPLTQPYSIVQDVNSAVNKHERSRLLQNRSLNHTVVRELTDNLRGPDAILLRTCHEVGLSSQVRVAYRTQKATILCDHIVDFGYREVREEEDILIHSGGVIAEVNDHYQDYFEYRQHQSARPPGSCPIHWVADSGPGVDNANRIATTYLTTKHKGELDCMYGYLYLMVDIPPSAARNVGKQSLGFPQVAL